MSGKTGPVPIIGIKADDPSRPPCRIELRTMRTEQKDQWNLFLLGMERFMDPTKEEDPLSYYQISGIHGKPYTAWPNQSWNNEEPIYTDIGYCTHNSVLFLTWHRPYLALYEQTLYKHVNEIAHEYGPDPEERRDAYIKAAKEFRLPYWDWARQTAEDITLFPKECWDSTKPKVIRPGSKGSETEMKSNPLAAYHFGSEGRRDNDINQACSCIADVISPVANTAGYILEGQFRKVNATLRRPNRQKTESDQGILQEMLKDFSQGKDAKWVQPGDPWSRGDAQAPKWNGYGSLEDIHNAVHMYVGGDGQMGDIIASAFDPIFWLHHNNIDRLFAIWQALHNDPTSNSTYVDPSPESKHTRMLPDGLEQDKSSKLYPFHASKDIEDFWTSEGVIDTKTFGYVYPETQNWVFPTKESIIAELDRLYKYGTFTNFAMQSRAKSRPSTELAARARFHKAMAVPEVTNQVLLQAVKTDGVLPSAVEEKVAKINLPDDRDIQNLVGSDNKYLEWLVNIVAERHANNGDFVVHVFIGDPEDDHPESFISNPNYVAGFSTLGQNNQTQCSKCQFDQAARLLVTGQIPLTLALAERYIAGLVESLNVDDIEPYLKKELHWRVTARDGTLLHRQDFPRLRIGVVTNEVTLPPDPSGFPQYAPEVVPRPSITSETRDGETVGRGCGTGYSGGNIFDV